MNFVVSQNTNYPIQPDHINAHNHFLGAFENYEKELSAVRIINFLQRRGTGWSPFTKSDIEEFFQQESRETFSFNGLLVEKETPERNNDFVVVRGESCLVTHQFIARCYLSSPAKE